MRSRGKWIVIAALGVVGCGRDCSQRTTPPLADDRPLEAKVIATGLDHPRMVATDRTHVYFRTVAGEVQRVVKSGGPTERVASSVFPPAGVSLPRDHAYFAGYGIEPRAAGDPDDALYEIDDVGVYRATADGARQTLARSFACDSRRKALLVDDTRVYWAEPAAAAVMSVPKGGGETSLVCEAPTLHYDLALGSDRIYLVDAGGGMSSAPRTGGANQYHGTLTRELGPDPNALWMTVDGDQLYIVSDATGRFPPPSGVRLDPSTGASAPPPAFDGRVVRVALPRGGVTLDPHMGGLVFATNVWMGTDGVPSTADLTRLGSALAPLRTALDAGRFPVTLSIAAGPEAASAARERAHVVSSWLREHVAAGVRVELSIRLPLADGDPGYVDTTMFAGIHPRNVPAIFAP